jgi:hypothetical protein
MCVIHCITCACDVRVSVCVVGLQARTTVGVIEVLYRRLPTWGLPAVKCPRLSLSHSKNFNSCRNRDVIGNDPQRCQADVENPRAVIGRFWARGLLARAEMSVCWQSNELEQHPAIFRRPHCSHVHWNICKDHTACRYTDVFYYITFLSQLYTYIRHKVYIYA